MCCHCLKAYVWPSLQLDHNFQDPTSSTLELGNRLKSTVLIVRLYSGQAHSLSTTVHVTPLSWLQPMVGTGDAVPSQLAFRAKCTVQNICFLQHTFLLGKHPRNSSDSSGHSQDHWGVLMSNSAVGACPALFMPRSSVSIAPRLSDIPNH